MHPPEARATAAALVAEGIGDLAISRRLGIPRRTIADWRLATHYREPTTNRCPRCWRSIKRIDLRPENYAELLGLYLGDGCISQHPRTQRLRITLDARYQRIVADTHGLLARVFSENTIGSVEATGCVHLSVYSTHLVCLFPQHAPGSKHDRSIKLEPWQGGAVAGAPWMFLRGLIRSDGCVFTNRTGPYAYLNYGFANRSNDIVDLFTAACRMVGVDDYRVNRGRRGMWRVRINRRASVALMREHVGLKA